MNPDEDLTSMAGAPDAQGADAASPVDDLSLDAAPTGDEEPTGDTPPEEGDEDTKDDEDNELNKKMTIDDVIAGMKRLLEVSQKKFEKLCADHNLDPVDYDDNPEADDMDASAGTPPPTDPNAAAGGDMPPADPNAAAGGMPPAPPPDLGGGMGGDMGAGAPPAPAPVQESEDEYECDECQFTTTSLTEMIEHLKNEHDMTSQEIDSQIKGFMSGVDDGDEDDMETPVHSEGDVLDISTDDEDTALTPMREPEDTMTSLTAIRTSVPVQTSDASTLKDRLIARLNDGTNRKVKPSALNVTTQTTAFDAFQAYTPVMRGDGGAWKKMDEFKNSFTPPEEGFEGLPEVYCIKLGDTTLCEDEYENPFFTKNIFEDSTCMFESLDDVGRMMAFLLKDNPNRKYAIHKCKIIDNTHFLLKKNCEEINESWWDSVKNFGSNAWQSAKNVGSNLYNAAGDFVNGRLSDAGGHLKDAGTGFVDDMKNTFTGGEVQSQEEKDKAAAQAAAQANQPAPTQQPTEQKPLPTTTAPGSAPTNAGPSAPPTGGAAPQGAKPLPTTTAAGSAPTNAGPSAPPTGVTATQSAKPLPTTATGTAPTNAGPSAPPTGGATPQGAKPLPTTTAAGSAPTNAGPSAPQASGAAAQSAKPLPTTTATGNAPTNAGPSAPPTGGAAPQGSTTIQPSGDTGGSTELPQVQTNAPAGQAQTAGGIEPQVKEQIKKVSQELSQLAAQLKE